MLNVNVLGAMRIVGKACNDMTSVTILNHFKKPGFVKKNETEQMKGRSTNDEH